MVKPGLSRAIPLAILGALAGALIVYFIRLAQSMDPVWDANVALVLMPWLMSVGFLWGMGALDPRMSEHAHGPEAHEDEIHSDIVLVDPDDEQHAIAEAKHDDQHHEPEPDRPFAVFSSQMWTITTITIAAVVSLFAFALLPHGLLLQTTSDDFGNPAEFATNTDWWTPLGIQIGDSNTFKADELSVFAGFIIFTMLSLFAFGGGLAFLFFFLNRQVNEVRADPSPPPTHGLAILVPPFVARLSGRLARGLRNGLPAFFGQK
jgi:hypothetical protein